MREDRRRPGFRRGEQDNALANTQKREREKNENLRGVQTKSREQSARGRERKRGKGQWRIRAASKPRSRGDISSVRGVVISQVGQGPLLVEKTFSELNKKRLHRSVCRNRLACRRRGEEVVWQRRKGTKVVVRRQE